jgi:uncharacterized glyoxalase superfamily protein PhnB
MTDIYPVIRYRDANAGIAFLVDAFGFERHAVHEDENGDVQHAELRYGDGMVMIGSGEAPPAWVYIVVDDADAHYERAKAAGATIDRELEDQDYGSRDYTAKDPEGNVFSFGTYKPS